MHGSLIIAEVHPMVAALAGVVGVLIGGVIGVMAVRILGGQTLSHAKEEATQIKRLAEAEAQTTIERAEVEAQKRALSERDRVESELQKQRDDLREQERRLAKREDQHERKLEALTLKEERLAKESEDLQARTARLTEKHAEIDALIEKQKEALLRVTDMSREQAEQKLLSIIEQDVQEDAAQIVRTSIETAQSDGRNKAQEIILNAIQRYAGEFAAESTVRTIPIPSDDIKGRIIGREGRNIRAIQQLTGVDLIVDDTPGVIVVSCFDKVRQ
ncbi:MAG: DUF3552 domain-containing protein, partial [Phycisphaeraceae bacterium]